jgi:hypothetical protein
MRMRKSALALVVALLTWARHCYGAEQDQGQWLAVTAPAFRAELAPLIEHRRAEGLKVVVIETTNVLSQEQIRQGNGVLLQDHTKHQDPTTKEIPMSKFQFLQRRRRL